MVMTDAGFCAYVFSTVARPIWSLIVFASDYYVPYCITVAIMVWSFLTNQVGVQRRRADQGYNTKFRIALLRYSTIPVGIQNHSIPSIN